jgi:hypothetical protein
MAALMPSRAFFAPTPPVIIPTSAAIDAITGA